MSVPTARVAAKVAGTFGAVVNDIETREARPRVVSEDVEVEAPASRVAAQADGSFGEQVVFETRNRRDEAVGPEKDGRVTEARQKADPEVLAPYTRPPRGTAERRKARRANT